MSWLHRFRKNRSIHIPHQAIPADRLLSYRAGNVQGQGRRTRQEDSFAFINAMDVTKIRQEGLVAILSDGMGGMESGNAVSTAVISGMRAVFASLQRQGDISRQLCGQIQELSDRIYESYHGRGGATLIGGFFYNEKLITFSVGDSRIGICRRGMFDWLHSPHNLQTDQLRFRIAKGELPLSPAAKDRDGHVLTSFMGMGKPLAIEVLRRPLSLRAGDILLFCSDGVSEVLGETVLRQCLQERDPTAVCTAINTRIRQAGHPGQDNYTALVVSCDY